MPEKKMYTSLEAAEILGLTSSRVLRLAKSRGLGTLTYPRVWMFTAADVEAMRDRKPGRPRKDAKEEG